MIILENAEKNSFVEVDKVSQTTEDYYSSDGTKKTITLKLFTNENQSNLSVTKKRTLLEAEFGNDEKIFLQLSAKALLSLANDLGKLLNNDEGEGGEA